MSAEVDRLKAIVATLRSPSGCPWDREQTHESLRAALLEECYEAIDAINRADDANLSEELGDLLLLVVMHAQMGSERGAFHFDQMAAAVSEKLVRRHPHVFGDAPKGDSGQVLRQWEQIKLKEKGEGASVLDGLPSALPALMKAQNVQKKVARVGFDWGEAEEVLHKIREEADELEQAIASGVSAAVREEVGDLLFSVVNLARKLGIESETALADATDKFIHRFRAVESFCKEEGVAVQTAGAGRLNELWEQAKVHE